MSHGLSILAFVLPIFCVTDSVSAQIVRVWDLAEKSQSGQMTFYNPDDNDAQYGTPISSADLNGDGSYCQMWCMAVRSSSDLIVSCLLNTIFEIDSSYDLFQVIEAT